LRWERHVAENVSVVFAILLGWATQGQAHDIYADLKDGWGRSCCHGADCRPAPYRITPQGVEMLIDGRWFPIARRRSSTV
jgi:hypothetical protein